jgi:hypothetical protein
MRRGTSAPGERSDELSREYGPGAYLVDPADLITKEEHLRCTECGREPRTDENAMEEWPCHLDEQDDMRRFCPRCAKGESGR